MVKTILTVGWVRLPLDRGNRKGIADGSETRLYGHVSMGRTVIPYTQIVDQERSRWQKFRRALRKEDQAHFDQLFELARLHTQAGVYASQPWPMEAILMSMLLEHQKALAALAERVRRLEGEGDDDPGLAL